MSRPLETQLRRLDARIEREIVRLRARYQLSLDEFRGLYVSDEQVDQLLGGSDCATGMPGDAARPSEGAGHDDPRWGRVVKAFGLSPLEEDLLLVALAPELDTKYETLYAYLNNDITRKWPTADLARRLLGDIEDGGSILAALSPAASLRARHLVNEVAAPSGRPAMLNSGFVAQPALTHWFHGNPPALALDGKFISWWAASQTWPPGRAAKARAEPILRLLGHSKARVVPPPLTVLTGQPGSGRQSTAVALAEGAGLPLARIDLSAHNELGDACQDLLASLGVVLALEPAIVLLCCAEARTEDDTHHARAIAQVECSMASWPASTLVLIRTSEEQWRGGLGKRRAIEVRCGIGTFPERLEAWRDATRSAGIDALDVDLSEFVGRFALTPGQVRNAMATACDLAAMQGCPTLGREEISAAARLESDQGLARLAVKVERMHRWSDLILPASTLRRLRELAAAIRHRHVVYGEWGFSERISTGLGIKALFAGASGTGKTMAAGVIARELALDLYKIDLSAVVSKYIGDTEKNLDRIFRAARAANAIVFLDEAEAILGKRSEVKDAHDRYANIEVAYLLQKLEEHDGIVILATNLRRNIDEAFNRRMLYVIDFPRPQESERERIWRSMFPPTCPLADDVDFGYLAQQFDLAGGDIRNVALDAAFLAAQDGGVIGMAAIVDALSRQLTKEGRTPTGADFHQYQRFLTKAGG
jgi:hypothetical protein